MAVLLAQPEARLRQLRDGLSPPACQRMRRQVTSKTLALGGGRGAPLAVCAATAAALEALEQSPPPAPTALVEAAGGGAQGKPRCLAGAGAPGALAVPTPLSTLAVRRGLGPPAGPPALATTATSLGLLAALEAQEQSPPPATAPAFVETGGAHQGNAWLPSGAGALRRTRCPDAVEGAGGAPRTRSTHHAARARDDGDKVVDIRMFGGAS